MSEPNSSSSTVEDLTKDGFKTLIEATKNSNSLPQNSDWSFYSTHQAFRNVMSKKGDKILYLINDILKKQNVHGNIKNRDFEEKIELIVEANDVILERVANNIDELSGIRKNPEIPIEIQTVSAELPVSGSWNKLASAKFTVGSTLVSAKDGQKSANSIRLLTAKNIQRPQASFKDRIDNSRGPWEPRIKEKPNNLKPLAIFLEEADNGEGEIFSHPYEFELSRFEPLAEQLTEIEPRTPKPLEETPLLYIDRAEQLEELVNDLRQQKEFSVDLEHHSYRSYMGITCLMQISTHSKDYIIDTLALRDKLHILNEVFTKPTIVKVFHGADNDVEWLQRDLSVYVVNMFDTHQAAKILSYPHLSLAYLLQRFCQVDANKHFQLADWRIRPLPEELLMYAREDTHYLLYIYHKMRNELLTLGTPHLRTVVQNSTLVCLRRYKKPTLHENSHMDLYRRCKKLFNNRQMYALQHLYQWRDSLARAEDESIGFVLPNHMLLQISELLPREMQGILACCNPIPPLVRANLLELHKIVLTAREQPLVKPILSEENRSHGSTQNPIKINIDSILNCPHDFSRSEEFRDDLPTLLGKNLKLKDSNSKEALFQSFSVEKNKATINIFDTPENSGDEAENNVEIKGKMRKLKFLGPYERYKLVKSYIQDEQETSTAENKDVPETRERTDTERIEALREHFNALAATTAQLPPTLDAPKPGASPPKPDNTPLSQMPGRKRKRNISESSETEPEVPFTVEEATVLQTPIPRPKYAPKIIPSEPTKFTSVNNEASNFKFNNKQKQKKGKFNNKFNKNQETLKNQQQYSGDFSGFRRDNGPESRPGRGKWRNNERKRKWNEGNQEEGNKRKREDQSENRSTFDYSAVDFQQFQGGAGDVNRPRTFKTNFKSRGSKNHRYNNIDRTNIKSSTFHGNRGRGGQFRGNR